MSSLVEKALKLQVRRARGKFVFMAGSYTLGVFNDNFFKQAAFLVAVGMSLDRYQGYIHAAFAIAYLLVAAVAGWMADRFPKHNVVIAAKGLEFVAMIIGAIGIATVNWPLIFAMAALMGMQSSIFSPSLNGSIPELYPASYVTKANSYLKAVTTLGILAGIAMASAMLSLGVGEGGDTSFGRKVVAGTVVGVGLLGFLASFGVPKRPAAAPHAAFPWLGPIRTLQELWRIRQDHLLARMVVCSTFIWFLGALEMLIINTIGGKQYDLDDWQTGTLVFAQLLGIVVGGVVTSLARNTSRFYRRFAATLGALALSLAAVAMVPLLPETMQIGALYVPLFFAGLFGARVLIPTEAFFQTRPSPDRKGAVIAAANFAALTGVAMAAPGYLLLLEFLDLIPTEAFFWLALFSALFAAWLWQALPRDKGSGVLNALVREPVRALLRLRYRVRVEGIDEVSERGDEGILFLPNHPALIDPVILMSELQERFAPHSLADKDQIDRPVIRQLARFVGARPMPDATTYGVEAIEKIEEVFRESIDGLRRGECFLMYPAGHLMHKRISEIGAASGVETILRVLPDVRVVLIRTRGLWGSSFSYIKGRAPKLGEVFARAVKSLLLGGIFLMPKRTVSIELVEPDDFPRDGDRATINRYLEGFYNADAPPAMHVPYTRWESEGEHPLPDPETKGIEGNVEDVPEATREQVLAHLRDVAGVSSVSPEDHLARDLNMDSLARVELTAWVEQEFGFGVSTPEALETVGDVMLAAVGEAVSADAKELKPIPPAWFRSESHDPLSAPEGETITAAFLAQAERDPNRIIVADQNTGAKTYRDMITGILALKPEIERFEGDNVGIMLPASVGADLLFLGVLFAGKTPVMVNWTAGPGNVKHSVDHVGVKRILTARALTSRLEAQGVDLSSIADRFVNLEELGASLSIGRKLWAALRARFSWRSLRSATPTKTAAILFTSGSESHPKAVPLTHTNILTNIRDVLQRATPRHSDRLIGILPPFHSFGLTTTIAIPLTIGLRTVYHANPTEAAPIARLIDAYKATMLFGTPTFLHSIVRAGEAERLATLRLAITGAEKCSERVYSLLDERCPKATVLEGYGVTECSPIVSVNDQNDPREGTIGHIMASLDHVLLDVDSGKRVGAGERGMLLVRGPSVFGGYINHDGDSPFVELDGKTWYKTGDIVIENEDGVLRFAGRLKRFVKLGGEMISLPAIEAVLEAHYPSEDNDGPAIAVESTPDEEHPEIVLFTTRDVEREEVNSHIRAAGLSALHNIRRIERVDAIPTLGTGKTDHRTLKERLKG